METVEEIVLLMAAHQSLTAASIAKSMKLKPISVRYHLANLLASRDIQRIHSVRTGHSGRPAFQYQLTPAGRSRATTLGKQYLALEAAKKVG